MRVVGIDVGPEKGAHIYDREYSGARETSVIHKTPNLLAQYLAELPQDTLIAWDSPLTAASSTDQRGALIASDLTHRVIEAFFSRSEYGFRPPAGISVRPYSGCPHWTISRRMLGLPRIGRYDFPNESLPFSLIVANVRPGRGRHVVEVHPALALWLWFRREREGESWLYKEKHNTGIRHDLWNRLSRRFSVVRRSTFRSSNPSDDELDAMAAGILAQCWYRGDDSVAVLGDAQCGAMLMPAVDGLQSAFAEFRSAELRKRSRRQERIQI
ncbi:MAG: DUF429 domain-containing protein [Paludibaculum sp.]